MNSISRFLAAGTLLAGLFSGAMGRAEDNDYTLGPDSQWNPAVPHGTVAKQTFVAGGTSVFPGTVRDYWIYVPKQYTGAKPACLMVFQDGGGYVSTNGGWRVPVVFDNLIARGEMPVTIGLFINPGVTPSLNGTNTLPRFNRSYEYDGLGDNYARFLAEELLPEVQKRYLISTDPSARAIAGSSSGAICAFTTAWERPDLFRRVFSTIGTYVGLRGGNSYPVLVRKMEPKPIRIFLQDGYNDQNIYGGNWWIANQDMYSALQFSGYAVEKAWGTGGHDGKHGGSILPKALKWLWEGYPMPVKAGETSKQPLMTEVLLPGQDWQLLAQGYKLPSGLCADAKGQVLFADGEQNRVYKISADGAVSIARTDTSGAQDLAVLRDGTIVAAQPGQKQLVAYGDARSEKLMISGTGVKSVAPTSNGYLYLTDPSEHAVKMVSPNGKLTVVDTGIEFPTGICLSPDQSLLFVSDLVGQLVYSYQIQTDGTLANRQPYFHLHLPDNPRGSSADGMCVDTQGRLYVATRMGVQVCDQAGRVTGIIRSPEGDVWITDVCFGGKNHDELYMAAGDKVWRRKTRVTGISSASDPIVPPAPRL
ncbi:MAG TPA: SMP-30/gluconolactonase/LRE family protein [Candidatus Limnocylindria bacterium]|nr:SMP-30/gluconolactonase/LRE family protein [Candidatus Limnocylindria bacterium]